MAVFLFDQLPNMYYRQLDKLNEKLNALNAIVFMMYLKKLNSIFSG